MTLDPGLGDDLPFALPGSGPQGQQQPSVEHSASAPPLADDRDGTLGPQDDAGQAGTFDEPDQGPAVGPKEAADAQEPAP